MTEGKEEGRERKGGGEKVRERSGFQRVWVDSCAGPPRRSQETEDNHDAALSAAKVGRKVVEQKPEILPPPPTSGWQVTGTIIFTSSSVRVPGHWTVFLCSRGQAPWQPSPASRSSWQRPSSARTLSTEARMGFSCGDFGESFQRQVLRCDFTHKNKIGV